VSTEANSSSIDDIIRGVHAGYAAGHVNACRQRAIEKEAIDGKAKQAPSWEPQHKIR